MASSIVYELCDTTFWDANSTWYTDRPQFSACFRDTVLVWVPACVFLITILKELLNVSRAKSKQLQAIPWNVFNRLRLLVTFILMLIKLTEGSGYVFTSFISPTTTIVGQSSVDSALRIDGGKLVLSTLLAPFIQTTCYLLLMVIYCLHRKFGIHTSGPIWFYLLISSACDVFEFYSVILSTQVEIFTIVRHFTEYVHFPTLLLLFLIECRGDTPVIEPDHDRTDVRPNSPELQASYFSSITFWWYNEFLLFGYRHTLELSNLWKTLKRDKAGLLVPKFRSFWTKTGRSSSKKDTYRLASGQVQPMSSIIYVLFKLFWPKLLLAASLKFMQDILQYVTPLILKKLLQYMNSAAPLWHGILLSVLFLMVPTVQSILLGNYFYKMQVVGVQVKTMIIGAVYRKALVLSGSSRIQSTSGEIVNLMAVDSHRFQDLLMYLNLFWSAPFQIMLAITLLYRELGWPVFAGVACMALFLPANAYLANRIKFAQIKLMNSKDERIKQMNEVMSGIKVIKLYAWENSFIANLFGYRERELKCLRRILNLDAIQTFLWQCSPFVVALVTFAMYVKSDPANILTAEKAFVSISLFNLLRFPLTMLPSLVTSLVLTVVSSRRLNKFLNSDELVRYVTRNEELEAISIEGGTLSWYVSGANEASQNQLPPASEKDAILKEIDFHVKPNSFVAIVGQVASGKSSLLASILGEMHRISGRFNVCKSMSMAYVPQQAWIQNLTVKDNILFGSAYDEQRYQQVLSVCSLHSDLETIPGGDQAEIGEKGINLSGGQKQRVSLARACYSGSDIYLLDDPLSALDSHVAKHVFDQVLSSTTGLLKDKTRVLATNSLFVLPHVDHIVVLDNGRVIESGSYEDLMKIRTGYLAECMRQYTGLQVNSSANKEKLEDQEADLSLSNVAEPIRGSIMKSVVPKPTELAGKLTEVERVETGSVGFTVYMKYFKAVSLFWFLFIIISLVASTVFNVATNLWLSIWSSDAESDAGQGDLQTMRLIVYASLGAFQCLTVLSGSIGLSFGAVKGAKRLHLSLLESVMHSPMSFFDTTPIGRIVNRFAKDIDVVDLTLPGASRSWLNCFLSVVSTLFIVCYSFPTFFAIIIPLGIVYFIIQKVFIVTTRQLKRLESITRSPIYSHFNETLSGIGTIRAYDCVDRFVAHSDSLVDRNQSCSYPNVIANRWLSIRLELFGNLITACAALFSVYYKGSIGAGVAGLTISYSLSVTQTLSWLVRMTSDLETHIVSVERILEYVCNNREDLWIKKDRPMAGWPDKGEISFQNYSTRYREGTELVLKNISLDVKPCEKIGIVGRTGSGKSSLSLSLFRILEPASGRIIIDKLDVANYGLHDLRSKLTIIPQDPVLFSGTLRFNLDPLQLYNDAEIWRALELAHLKAHITTAEAGLDYRVSEYGENFSVGQRQLICLARAILRKSKILILDEATASVDLETDSIVQKTIKDIFSDCTIITIAHRLHTILDSDRILVLDYGSVKELDSPANLISDTDSALYSLIRDAGIGMSGIIKESGNN